MAVEGKTFWGYSEILLSGNASRIKVYGEKTNKSYTKYSAERIRDIFGQDGKVFLPKPITSYHTFQVTENANRRNDRSDSYMAIPDTVQHVPSYNLIRKKNLIGESLSPNEINKIFKHELVVRGKQEIDCVEHYIFFDNTKELIGPFVKHKDEDGNFRPKIGKEAIVYDATSNLDGLCIVDHVFFNFPDVIFERKDSIDCMSDEQLKNWFRDKLKEINKYSSEEEIAITTMVKMLKKKAFPSADDLDSVRFKRILDILDQYEFSYDELKDIIVKDGYEIICKKINDMRLEIKRDAKLQIVAELKEFFDKKIELENKIESIRLEINELEPKKNELEQDIKFLSERYDKLVYEFRLKAKIKPHCTSNEKQVVKPASYEIYKTGNSFAEIKNEDYGEEELYHRIVKKNLVRIEYDETVIDILERESRDLLKACAVFIPCISWAYIFAQGIGNAKVYTMHVEHDWLHYRDFAENGLISIWNEAWEEKGKNHILVLENLNITQPECGCTPLLDVINGYRPVLEGTEYGLPENLKIFATVIPYEENVGLKLSKRLFRCWSQFGDFKNNKYFCAVKDSKGELYGHFEPNDFLALYNSTKSDCKLGEPYFDE